MKTTKELKELFAGGAKDELLKDIYIDEAVIDYQRQRYVDAISRYEKLYGCGDVEIYSAPGRSEIGGNHTDHQNGEVLAASINLDAIGIVGRLDGAVRVVSGNAPEIVISLDDLEKKESEKETTKSLIKGVLAGIREHGGQIGGFQAYITSDVLIGAGLSSSAAFETIIGTIVSGLYNDMKISVDEALAAWTAPLEKVFPTRSSEDTKTVDTGLYEAKDIYVCKNRVAKPKVFIPVFPGTNCEYDSAKAFERAGAEPVVKVFKNMTAEDIRDSVDVFVKAIDDAQMIMFPGGFSAGDEPEGSAKFFATAFRNEKMKEAVMRLLNERDGLALGICNGFQALIKLGLVPYGEIRTQSADAPTLTYNTIGRHISKMVYTKVVSNKSPWLAQATLGATYCNPASHGEGRFVAPKECIEKLFAQGQVATQYVNEDGQPTMDEEWNVNGSYAAIEGITSPDGRVLGKMAHSERRGDSVAINIYGEQDVKIFESGVAYFR